MNIETNNITQENNLPDITSFQNLPQIAVLTLKQQSVLFYMLQAITQSDDSLTDAAIAEKAGVSANMVLDCRHNPQFISLYTSLVKEITKSHTGLLVNRLFEQSKKSTKAAEILLKYSDQLIEKRQSLNANLNYTSTNPSSHLENLVSTLKQAGYTKERLISEIDQLWDST